MRRKFEKGFVEATSSNPDLRSTQSFLRKRSMGKGVPGRGNTTSSVWRLQVPAGLGNSKCSRRPTTQAQREGRKGDLGSD